MEKKVEVSKGRKGVERGRGERSKKSKKRAKKNERC